MKVFKVLHFVTTIDKSAGGIAACLQQMAPRLAAQMEVVVVAGRTPHPVSMEGVKVTLMDLSLCRWFALEDAFRQILKLEKPDIVHINGIWEPQTWLFQRVAQQLGIRVVLSPHGMMEPWILSRNRWKKQLALALYQRRALQSADSLHATADSERLQLQKLGYTRPIAVVPNGVDLGEAVLKTDWRVQRRLLFLSRIHPKKGIEVLIDAVQELRYQLQGYQVVVAGEGEPLYVEQLRQLCRNKGLEEIISFAGGVYGAQKWELFRQSDIFVLPTYSENFGIVIAEALACGTPVITTTGTPWSILNDNRCGWWIPPRTENLIAAIREAVSLSSGELEEMGRRGQKTVLTHFEANSVAGKMMDLYLSLHRDFV